MARIARLVVPGYPHHVIQRGNRKQTVFFHDEDRKAYLKLIKHYSNAAGVQFLAWCLMDNHVHCIAIPSEEDSFRSTFGEAHQRYTRRINFRYGWRGYLWQGRFSSYILSEQHLYAAVRYVELNPVKAGIVKAAEDYPWSSAKAHVYGTEDLLGCDLNFFRSEIADWRAYLGKEDEASNNSLFEKHAQTGRPLGNNGFLAHLESITGRRLQRQKPGPKPKQLFP